MTVKCLVKGSIPDMANCFKNVLLHKRDLIVTVMQGIEHYTHTIIFTDVLRVGIILEYT